MRIIDTDAHYLEILEDLAGYIEDDNPWKERFATSKASNIFPNSPPDHYMYGRIRREAVPYPGGKMKPEHIPLMMDQVNADATILLSNRMLHFSSLSGEDARPVALANAYTDMILDKVVSPDEGIFALVPIPYQDPDAAVDLITRVQEEKGIVGVCIVTAGVEPPLGHRKYDPIYETAENANLPVVFHSGGGSLDHFYLKGFEKFIETHTLGFVWNNMAQLASLTIQGVPEKFPDLEIIFQESGIFWVPLMMYRLDAEYLKRQSEAPLLTKRPSEYIKKYYFGTQPLEQPQDEQYLEVVMKMIGGPERLLYASDYPHWDYDPPDTITELSFLSDEEKRQILSGNAENVFGI